MIQLKENCPHECKEIITINCQLCYNDWRCKEDLYNQNINNKKIEEMFNLIFNRFDQYSCIKNDKWYLDLKLELKQRFGVK